MESTDSGPEAAENLPKPKLYGLKTALALTVVFMFGWGYYLLVEDTLLRSALDAAGRDLPDGVRKFGGALAFVAALVLPIYGVLYALMKAGIWLDFRRALKEFQADVEAQRQAALEDHLKKMKEEGASAESIAEFRKEYEDAMAEVAAKVRERTELYKENPALAEHDYQVAVEGIRAKQRLKEF